LVDGLQLVASLWVREDASRRNYNPGL